MSQEFDPYYKWLGIPPKDQPPNHYRLLGLELFESDAEVIDAAASRLMEYLQGVSVGPHAAQSQALLNEIAAARLCLLDRKKKASYDRKLKAAQVAAGPPEVSPQSQRQVRGTRGAVPPPPPAGPPVTLGIHVESQRSSSSPTYRLRQKRPPWLVAGALSVVLLGACGVGLYLALVGGSGDATHATGGAKSNKPTAPRPSARSPHRPRRPHAKPGQSPLIQLAELALKRGDAKEAMGHYQTYLETPGAADYAQVKVKLETLKRITSDNFAMESLAEKTDQELEKLEKGGEAETELPPDLHAVFMETLRRNIPQERLRRHPDKFLKSKGLQPQAGAWLLDEKTAIADLKPLAALRDECNKADQKVAQVSQKLNKKAANAELFGNVDLREALQARAELRAVLALAVLKQQAKLAQVRAAYAVAAKDAKVTDALARLKDKSAVRLGPSDAFNKYSQQFARFEALALGDEVPYYFVEFNGPRPMINVIINEVVFCGVTLRNDPEPNNLIPQAIAEKAGLKLNRTTGVLTEVDTSGKEKKYTCAGVDVPTLRMGRHVLRNLMFMATPKGVLSPPSLDAKVFTRFQITLDRESFVGRLQLRTNKKKIKRPAKAVQP